MSQSSEKAVIKFCRSHARLVFSLGNKNQIKFNELHKDDQNLNCKHLNNFKHN